MPSKKRPSKETIKQKRDRLAAEAWDDLNHRVTELEKIDGVKLYMFNIFLAHMKVAEAELKSVAESMLKRENNGKR